VCDLLSDAATMGYRVLAVSGGEPLMYPDLGRVLQHAKSLGLRTTVTTNGTLLTAGRLRPLVGLIDLLAISLDGPAEIHNDLRASPRAFSRVVTGLDQVRRHGFSFGFIHTLTRRTCDQLEWLAEFASANGAALLQLHPLELAGRGSGLPESLALDEEALNRAFLTAFILAARYRSSMTIHLDTLHRQHVLANPAMIYASEPELGGELEQVAPASLLSLIVLEPDGSVVPLSYGFARAFELCDVRRDRLAERWPAYLRNRYPGFRRLCRRVFQELCEPGMPALFNWHEVIVARSHAAFEEAGEAEPLTTV
jgi:MoaA/NifB/PqqE/SkfB family radical SAM enzyme